MLSFISTGSNDLGKAALTDSAEKNICGKMTRKLVPGTHRLDPGHVHQTFLLFAAWAGVNPYSETGFSSLTNLA